MENKTEKDLINEAWAIQDACNLSGVVHSFSRALIRLRDIFEDRRKHCALHYSTRDINEHIVSKLYGSKIMSLCGELPLDLTGLGIDEIDRKRCEEEQSQA